MPACLLTDNTSMTIFAINLVIAGMDFMGEKDRLVGFISRLTAKINRLYNSNFSDDEG